MTKTQCAAAALRKVADLLDLCNGQEAALRCAADLQGCIFQLSSEPTKQAGQQESLPDVSNDQNPQSGQKLTTGQLFELPPIAELRLQPNRQYSDSPAAVRKRRQRARLAESVPVLSTHGQKLSQVDKKCPELSNSVPILSQNVPKRPKTSQNCPPLASKANSNNLATPSKRAREHLGTLGIEVSSLFLNQKPLDAEIAGKLDSLQVPHAYFSVLAERYMPEGLETILGDVLKQRGNPKMQRYYQTRSHVICNFLRWVINGKQPDKFGRIKTHLRLTDNTKRQLYPAANINPKPQASSQEEPLSEAENQVLLVKALDNLPWLKENAS